jgi:hypothetical protein
MSEHEFWERGHCKSGEHTLSFYSWVNNPIREPTVVYKGSRRQHTLTGDSMNAPVLVPVEGETDPLEIALKELAAKKVPLVIRRYLPGEWPAITSLCSEERADCF